MRELFDTIMSWVFDHEGGYVNHPRDPGGSTNLGITQGTLNSARRGLRDLPADVRDLTRAQAKRIYAHYYWHPVWGNDLPAGVDYVAFDGAVNSGPPRSVKWLQRVTGAVQDGVMGVRTLAAINAMPPVLVIERACAVRRSFLQRLSTFDVFGRGWMNRVNRVEAGALKLAGAHLSDVKERSKGALRRTDKVTGGAAGTATATGGGAFALDGYGIYVAGAAVVIVIASGLWAAIRHRNEARRMEVIEEELSA